MRLLTTLLVLLLFLLFVLPNPGRAGVATGNAIDSLVLFFRSAGNEAFDSVSTTSSSGGTGTATYPSGGVETGDGSAPTVLAAAPLEVPALPVGASADLGGEATLAYSPPVQLRIPAIGVSTGFVRLGLQPDGAMEVPRYGQMAGWYRNGPTPGQRGAAVVAGHVDLMGQSGVFAELGRLRPGDEVAVDRRDRTTAVFRVTRAAQYPKSHFPTEEVYGGTDGAELRLISCGGRFDHAARSYTDNVVVYARMVRVLN